MSDLSDFLRKKKAEYEQEQLDWNRVKLEWIHQIKDFMGEIKKWLEQPIKEGLIDVVEHKIEITEEHLGTYAVLSLEITVGAESIRVTPIGRLIIGASGRIDISSYIERFIILFHSDKGWIYRNEREKGSFQKLTEENFTKMLKELV